VPAEALGPLSVEGTQEMGHAAFRVFVALCRFRGASRTVNPSQETLASMTGLSRNNVSRATRELAARGWLVARHEEGNPRKRVVNYELSVPTPGLSPGVPAKATRAQRNAAKAVAVELSERPVLSQPKGLKATAVRLAPEDEVARDLVELASLGRLPAVDASA
jgi:DNA-binding transcriptional MocR family regulator